MYGYGLPTAGTYSLDHYNYGAFKSFGVLGQQGMNKKTYHDLVEQYLEAKEAINSGFGEILDKEKLSEVKKAILNRYV